MLYSVGQVASAENLVQSVVAVHGAVQRPQKHRSPLPQSASLRHTDDQAPSCDPPSAGGVDVVFWHRAPEQVRAAPAMAQSASFEHASAHERLVAAHDTLVDTGAAQLAALESALQSDALAHGFVQEPQMH